MKKIIYLPVLLFSSIFSFSQSIDKIINASEVERIERILSADDMQGRKTFTPGNDKAAEFIASEFAKSKLKFFGNAASYFQEITMTKTKPPPETLWNRASSLEVNPTRVRPDVRTAKMKIYKELTILIDFRACRRSSQ